MAIFHIELLLYQRVVLHSPDSIAETDTANRTSSSRWRQDVIGHWGVLSWPKGPSGWWLSLPLRKMMDFVSWDKMKFPSVSGKSYIKFHGSSHQQPVYYPMGLSPILIPFLYHGVKPPTRPCSICFPEIQPVPAFLRTEVFKSPRKLPCFKPLSRIVEQYLVLMISMGFNGI